MSKAIYPGSFDPLTKGHINVIERLSRVCDELVVLIANSPKKNYLFSAEERHQMTQQCMNHLENVQVDVYDGLTVEYASRINANLMIRGVRGAADLEYEMTMSAINKKLHPNIETLILPATPEYSFVASRLVKEVAHYKGDLGALVPPAVEEALKKKYNY
ncbi:MAG: pantetheine-phosphate adenylyltransferase [Bdellovibrionaceae bacterium]|nr:pantetheine-phosphate adenylyltransferase [Pseudobdellovibrionaceae bacterium]|tara:strand:+ start:96841 stop:97320 length:480 start_codon:yes stop_codon:yes gene_type:complete